MSMLAPQWLQATLAVEDMRTIVECSPQFGHTETSSNRVRQFTQRERPGRFVVRSHGSPQWGQAGPGLQSGIGLGCQITPTREGESLGAVAMREKSARPRPWPVGNLGRRDGADGVDERSSRLQRALARG